VNATACAASRLRSLPVLVVEDESLVAMLLEDMLHDLGCEVVGPVSRVADALALLEREPVAAAILDINVAGEKVFPVADRLEALGVPFLFATGYGAAGVAEPHQGREVLQKPYRMETLERALERALPS
jgi:CheY-like chemotaxis protein